MEQKECFVPAARSRRIPPSASPGAATTLPIERSSFAASACCAAWYAAQQNCSIERMTRPKHCRNDTQGTPPSETEGGIRRTENRLFSQSEGDFKNLGSWRHFGHFAAVGKVTRSGERNPPPGERNSSRAQSAKYSFIIYSIPYHISPRFATKKRLRRPQNATSHYLQPL